MTSPAPTKRTSNSPANTTPRKRHRSSGANGRISNTTALSHLPSPPSPRNLHPKPSTILTLPTVVHCIESNVLSSILNSLPEDELRALLTAHVSQPSNLSSTLTRQLTTTVDQGTVAEPKPSKHITFDGLINDTVIAPLQRFTGEEISAERLVQMERLLERPDGPLANVRLLHAQALPSESFPTRADALIQLTSLLEFFLEGGMLNDEKRRRLLDCGEDDTQEGPVGKAFREICEGMTALERSMMFRLSIVRNVAGMVRFFLEAGVFGGVVEGFKLLAEVEEKDDVMASAVSFEPQLERLDGEMDEDEGVSLIGVSTS
ncbi:hypothetical protein B0T14DRAFT_555552 [Immersiella caudata]|uniref:Uncharacterized protein n=1 Tax=Immersiella caudata TaxID=314043 RepID=A0AA40C0C2_9PEZI|nr:hypothetical protein B0T14DRAFT_555552 [Immersiella caudata]